MTSNTEFKVKKPRKQTYYVGTKDGKICVTSSRKADVIAWKRAFGASLWKATISYEPAIDDMPKEPPYDERQ